MPAASRYTAAVVFPVCFLSVSEPVSESLRVALVAGEASGDMLGAMLLRGLRQRWPQLRSYGIGGAAMQEQGFTAYWSSERLAVRGYVEVLVHYREIVSIRKQLLQRLLADPPDVFIGIDAPDFNLDLEAELKKAGVKTVHFISPSIWAWRGERIEKIRRAADHVLCIFPFEPALYQREGIAASYVGHPLAEHIPVQPDVAAARHDLNLDADATVLALLPGSRASEVKYLARRFIRAAVLLHRQLTQQQAQLSLQCVLPVVPPLLDKVQQLVRSMKAQQLVRVVKGQSHTVLAACDIGLIASGTATLEAALYRRPMVIAYNMHAVSWQLMKRRNYQPWVGLPNILCRDFVVPELLQKQSTAPRLAAELLSLVQDTARCERIRNRFAQLHTQLHRDTATLACDAVEQVLQQHSKAVGMEAVRQEGSR